ncbi:ankyrin repeat protein, partial [Morchella snyderi]
TSGRGETALQCAAWQGRIEMVRFLLDHGADINARDDKFGKSALHQAVVRGWAEVVHLLLQRGADVAVRDHGGMTPLLWAVKCQSAEGGDEMSKESMVDMQEYERGETALHWAVWRGQRLTVKLLTEFGADADVASVDGETAVEWAVRKGDDE